MVSPEQVDYKAPEKNGMLSRNLFLRTALDSTQPLCCQEKAVTSTFYTSSPSSQNLSSVIVWVLIARLFASNQTLTRLQKGGHLTRWEVQAFKKERDDARRRQ
ncbi:hypothetical protein CEXT_683591 [Caerostris extrusa]|uniref:Uncharacterized protein n=1 Tax=Caerostris extrusa TaxID=172846 RepID=A0AAV4NI15_CAEEX|nr:hypothetical protein CEXT_683591 [Caerostris extrusa]